MAHRIQPWYHPPAMSGFHLSKWYLDCVTDAGDAPDCLLGRRLLGKAEPPLLQRAGEHGGADVKAQQSATPTARARGEWRLPTSHWRAKALHVDAEWQADAGELRATLLDDERGSIQWHCLMPRARARFGLRSGLGYAERLVLTIPPWKLPIETLRWGRFSSPSDWIVWIDWQGEHPQTIVYRNGARVAVDELGDEQIRFCGRTLLAMDRSLTIREGPLGTTALAAIPLIGKTFPARLLRVTESKWRSRARLEFPNRPAVEGFAIHERVSWPL